MLYAHRIAKILQGSFVKKIAFIQDKRMCRGIY